MVKFWSKIYKNWKPTNKIMFWIGISGILLGIISFVFNSLTIMINENNIINSSLKNSPIIQESPGTSITYVIDESTSKPNMDRLYYNKDLKINLGKSNYSIYNIKIILPSGQEAYIKKLTTINKPKEYVLASSNEEFTDFFIPSEHIVPKNLNEDNICYYFVITHDNIMGQWYKGKKFDSNKESCLLIKDVYQECHDFITDSFQGIMCYPELIPFALEMDKFNS